MIEYICDQCNTTYRIDALLYTNMRLWSTASTQLKEGKLDFQLTEWSRRDSTLWRYRQALPIADEGALISLARRRDDPACIF